MQHGSFRIHEKEIRVVDNLNEHQSDVIITTYFVEVNCNL